MDANQLQDLIARYNAGSASAGEKLLLEEWYDQLVGPVSPLDHEQKDLLKKNIYARLREQIPQLSGSVVDAKPARVRMMYTMLKWAAACIVVALVAWFYFSQKNPPKDISKTTPVFPSPADIEPGGTNAFLTLFDGKKIVLNEVANGKIAEQGTTEINKTSEGEIVYQVSGQQINSGHDILYNTISTPRGGQYLVVLPDGSRVWLNAFSSIRFPAAFTGNERQVDLTGEAYFEVAKDLHRPFRVNTSGQIVEVLGTHFNINAYNDEPSIRTTLLEGRIKVKKEHDSVVLKPGQQSLLIARGKTSSAMLTVKNSPDTEEIIAWKNGKFQFNESDILTIMRQVSRWYDVDIVIEGALPAGHFNGKIPRNVKLSQVLKILELNGFHFKTEGRKLIIKT